MIYLKFKKMSNRKKTNFGYEKDNSDYYYSSDDSEDEMERAARKSRLNTIKSNFTQTYLDSPINRNSSINISVSNEENKLTQINFTEFGIKRAKSDIRIIKINRNQAHPKKYNYLSFFTYNYNRNEYLEIKANNNYSQKKNDSHKRVNWKLFYDTIFRKNNAQNKNKNNINLEIDSNNIEKYRFDILIDKIKNRIKKKYEHIKDEDMDNKENNMKKINMLPEILSNLKKNEDNLRKIYKIGISEKDKNKFIPLFINKLQNKFNMHLNKPKHEKRKQLNSPFNIDKNSYIGKYSQKKVDRIKKITFENVNKKYQPKLSMTEEKLESHFKNNFNSNNNDGNFIRKTNTRITNFSLDKKKLNYNKNDNGLITSLNKRKMIFTRKSVSNVMKKKVITGSNISPKNGIVFNKNEINNIDEQKTYITDDIFEQFKNNSKIIINDEVLFKELKKKYPDYEEEIFNLYNNFLLFEKIYDRQGLRNFNNKKNYKDYNHSINNFLSTNKIKFLLSDKYEISHKILENCRNIQTIINYLNN